MEQFHINTIQNKFHHLSQYLAAFSNSFLTKREDDSQSALIWSIEKSALQSQEVKDIYIELNYKDVVLKIYQNNEYKELDILGLTQSSIDSWIRETISDYGLSAGNFHYNLGFKLEADFDTFVALDTDDEKIIFQLIEERNIAQRALENLKSSHKNASIIYVWPHHFDTGMLIPIDKEKGLGLGYAIADTEVNKLPYYYAYAWSNNTINYAQLPNLKKGNWVLGNWNGAIISVDDNYDLGTIENFYSDFNTILKKRI